MRKHLSVLALAARGTVCKVIAVTLLAAVLAGALLGTLVGVLMA